MRWSQYFIPTLREDPADAEVVSHKLLLRAGLIRQLGAGIYSYLPLGQRVALKIMQILREEMNRIGGQEFYLPALHPAEIWKESGRWDAIGDEMFRLKDRKGARHVPGHDARRSLYDHCAQRTSFLQTTAAGLVSDSDQVSRRGAAKVGPDAPAHLHHEGRLHV